MTPEEQEQLINLKEELKRCNQGCALEHMGMAKLELLLTLLQKEAS